MCEIQHWNNFKLFHCCISHVSTPETETISAAEVVVNLLGRVALVRGKAGYSRQTFQWKICRCIGLSSALWKNGRSDPDAVWHHRSDGTRDEAGSGVWGSVHGKGYFRGQIWGAIVTNGDLLSQQCYPLHKLIWADLFQSCFGHNEHVGKYSWAAISLWNNFISHITKVLSTQLFC